MNINEIQTEIGILFNRYKILAITINIPIENLHRWSGEVAAHFNLDVDDFTPKMTELFWAAAHIQLSLGYALIARQNCKFPKGTNGKAFKDEESFHREFCFKFGFPDYYGMNFNALYDCFSSLDEPGVSKHWKLSRNEEIVMQVRDAKSFIDSVPIIFQQLIEVIVDANKNYQESGSLTRILIELI